MSLLAAAALGASALSGLSGASRRRQSEKALGGARDDLKNASRYIDDFSTIADRFAQYGQDRLQRYESMFQPLEEYLNDYYTNLNADEFAGRANQTAQQQYQNAMKQVNDQLAARGLSTSGVGSQMGYDLANNMAMTKASNIMNAPHQVAQMQQNWLGGYAAPQMNNAFNQYAQGVGMQGNVANMYQNNANALANIGLSEASFQDRWGTQDIAGMGDALGAAGYFGTLQPRGADGSYKPSTFMKWGWQ